MVSPHSFSGCLLTQLGLSDLWAYQYPTGTNPPQQAPPYTFCDSKYFIYIFKYQSHSSFKEIMKIPLQCVNENTRSSMAATSCDSNLIAQVQVPLASRPISKRRKVRNTRQKKKSLKRTVSSLSTTQNAYRNELNPQLMCSTLEKWTECRIEPGTLESPTKLSISPEQGPRNSIRTDESELIQIHKYLLSICEYIHKKGDVYTPKRMLNGSLLFETNRKLLVEWVFELSSRLDYTIQTCYLAVNIIDRMLGCKELTVGQFANLGVTALFMASKYQEIVTHSLQTLVSVVSANHQVTIEQVIDMENQILMELDFSLGYSSPLLFIHQTAHILGLPQGLVTNAMQLTRLLVTDTEWRFCHSGIIAKVAIKHAIAQQMKLNCTQSSLESQTHRKTLKQMSLQVQAFCDLQ